MVFIRNLLRLTYILTINYLDKIAILYLPYYRLRPNKDATITKTSAFTPTILQYIHSIRTDILKFRFRNHEWRSGTKMGHLQ
jgi:hypothetical protein